MIRSGDLQNHAIGGHTLTTRPTPRTETRDGEIVDLATHPDAYVTVSQLARYWKVHPETVRRQILKGALRKTQIGTAIRIATKDALAYGTPPSDPHN